MTYNLLVKLAIEIVTFPSNMVIFHSYFTDVSQPKGMVTMASCQLSCCMKKQPDQQTSTSVRMSPSQHLRTMMADRPYRYHFIPAIILGPWMYPIDISYRSLKHFSRLRIVTNDFNSQPLKVTTVCTSSWDSIEVVRARAKVLGESKRMWHDVTMAPWLQAIK